MTFSTLYDFVETAKEQTPLGRSGNRIVVELPIGGRDNYLLKVDTAQPLRSSTALTPVIYSLEENFGQPVLVDSAYAVQRRGAMTVDDVSHALRERSLNPLRANVPLTLGVLEKVPGRSLSQHLESMYDKTPPGDALDRRVSANTSMLETLAGLPDFSFERWMEGKRRQLDKRTGGDNHFGNVLYDEQSGRLHDIDVVDHMRTKWQNNNVAAVFEGLMELRLRPKYASRYPAENERQGIAAQILRDKMARAALLHGVPQDVPIALPGDNKLPVFRPTNLRSELGGILLSEHFEKLSPLLAEVKTRSHITTR